MAVRLVVVVPSSEHLDSAGVRIRYDRMRAALTLADVDLAVVPLAKLFSGGGVTPGDHVLFSKCYTAAVVPLASWLSKRGHPVGIDVFDDYFSQGSDARLLRYRIWLDQVAPLLAFAVASTGSLRDLLRRVLPPHAPIALVGDAAPAVDFGRLVAVAARKAEQARFTRRLDAVWFGIGTNPFFSIGLRDLVAFSDELARFRALGWTVDLTVLTNLDAITAPVAAMLRRLPVRWTLVPWSVEAEQAVLDRALFCYLPVNGQSFSRAKTLNRAVAALSAGTQVLANGYPLYRAIEAFTYTSADALVADLDADALKLRPATVAAVSEVLLREANAYAMAEDIHAVLASTASAAQPAAATMLDRSAVPCEALVQGAVFDPLALAHNERLNVISVKSPFTITKHPLDIEFRIEAGGNRTDILVRDRLIPAVVPALQPLFGKAAVKDYHRIALDDVVAGGLHWFPDLSPTNATVRQATYDRVMRTIFACIETLFPGIRCTVADRSALHMTLPATPVAFSGSESVHA